MRTMPQPLKSLVAAALVISAAAAFARARGPEDGRRWVGAWAAAPQLTEPANLPPAPGLADTTLRQVVHVSLGGKRIRVRLSNEFGKRSLNIISARVGVSAGEGAVREHSDKPLTFSGEASVTIPAGAPWLSDPLDFDLAPLSDLVVTIYVKDPTAVVTGHPGARCHSYLKSGDSVGAAVLKESVRTPHWYYLCGVDVSAEAGAAVAVLGDSITDGRGSPTDGNGRWTDHLARRLQADPRTANIGVLNLGLGGNRILNDGLGPSAMARFDRDIVAQPGVRWAIVLEGINDLGTRTAKAADLIRAYEQMIDRAHTKNIRIFGATILPCGGSFYAKPELEKERLLVNEWIRSSGRFDGVIDFDAVLRDPGAPARLAASADGGDHLHPGPEGYKIMAESIDLTLFEH